MLFSQNIPPLPSPTESKILFCTSVSLFLFCIKGYHYHLSKFHIYVLVYCIGLYLLGIHTEETRSERDTCTPMFIPALFIIARTWKQPRCPSAYEWIRKLWYIYTTEYYSAIKKNSFESVLMRWMKLEPTIQSEVTHNLLKIFPQFVVIHTVK